MNIQQAKRLPPADVLARPVFATQASQGLLRWRQEDTEMSLTITLTPQVEHRIRDLIESGHYPDADAVIQKALQALAEQEHARFLKTRELVLAGLNGGEGEELTPELWDRLEREAEEDERLGLPIRDEVKP
jgi:putative addiction module CopG family antidote